MSGRILLIGLDGGTLDVIRPLRQQGRLPTFDRLMREGAWGELESTLPSITPPAFASLLTGCNPGKHGVFDFYSRQPGGYNPVPANGTTIKTETLPQILSRHQRAVGSVNVPMSYPPRPLNGFMVTDMMTPPGAAYTYPAELQTELDAMGYRIELDQWYRRGRERETLDAILSVLHVQERAVRTLMAERPWDFLAVVFRATDLAQHYFWRFMDPGHPDYTEGEGRAHGDLIPRVYEECDAAIARLMEAAGPETTVLVVSDHGFGRETKMVHLSNWLRQLGYLRFQQSPLARLKKLTFDLGLTADNVMNTLGRLGLEKLFTRASRETKSRIFASLFLNYGDIDWAQTRAYARGQIGQIFLNVRGREPQGIVEPGEPYYQLRAEIVERLLQLRDPDNGQHMVDRVYLQEEIYTGTHAKDGPDILIDWRNLEYWAFDVLAGGRKIVAPNLRTRSGGHRMNGIFFARGPEVTAGRVLEGARIVDVAPTILHQMALPVPEHMDGRVLHEIFAETARAAQTPIAYEHTNGAHAGASVGYTAEEEEKVKERLRQLGYLS